MPGWSSFVQIFDRSGKTKACVVEGRQAMDMLQQVDILLDESSKLLAGAKPQLTKEQQISFEDKHHQLYLAVVSARADLRDNEERDTFFSSEEEKAEFYSEIRQLLRQCRSYHRNVVTASQRAHASKNMVKLKALTAASASVASSGSNQTWLTVTPTTRHSAQDGQPGPPPETPDLPYLASVAHIPQSALATEEELLSQLPNDNSYYRILICGNKFKRAVVLDPNPHQIKKSDSDEDDAERVHSGFLQVGDMLMANDLQTYALSRKLVIL
ncbi:hypothetical protein RSAG8_08782, partial [Rhizoctonia solani AG-8 WAC10335]